MARPEKHIFICGQARPPGHPRGSCADKGAADVLQTFQQQFEQQGFWGRFGLTSTGCLGVCDAGPAVLVYPEGVMYGKVTKDDVDEIIKEHLLGGKPVERLQVPADLW